nr:MAG TPA: hypothetical protein [Caudoviricetes sp.]
MLKNTLQSFAISKIMLLQCLNYSSAKPQT